MGLRAARAQAVLRHARPRLRPPVGLSSLEIASRYAYVGRSRPTFDARTSPVMGAYADMQVSAVVQSTPERPRIAGVVPGKSF
ncbi:hypothetical protein [Phenylobacterium sp.]|uniref:hypothetical protein n=1 Tax=Phenylobacterium sp. TaxID=1871053 RepID=UPI002DE63DFE|nr:hypothetical protein [Phenylobacterium sp.]